MNREEVEKAFREAIASDYEEVLNASENIEEHTFSPEFLEKWTVC